MLTYDTGSFSLSVSLSLTLESLFGVTSETVNTNEVQQITTNTLELSITSVVRSILGSMDTKSRNTLIYKNQISRMGDAVKAELIKISLLCNNNNIKLNIYGENIFTNTSLPLIERKGVKGTKLHFISDVTKTFNAPIFKGGSGLLITSNPFDLLEKGSFSLLENHTGKILSRLNFSKKLNSTKVIDSKTLPYNMETLKTFGDTYGYIKVDYYKKRDIKYEALMDNRVTPITEEVIIKKILKELN